jgi:[acyl-carrier-protein] S-malonyltransferase
VISGHLKAVERAVDSVNRKGKRAMLLPVSAPFHSPLMKGAGERLEKELEGVSVKDLRIPVVTNVEAEINDSKERVKSLLIAQVSNPVRWETSMKRMASEGVTRVIEIGPGKVLSGLMRRIDSSIATGNVEDLSSLRKLS